MIVAKLTQQQFDALAEKLRVEEGLDLAGKTGKLSKDGAVVTYSYDGTALTLTVLKSPFPLSLKFVENKLREALAAQGCAAE